MSLLNALRERLLGQASMMRPGQGFGGGTQGLLGAEGRFGGGLLQTRMNEPGGLLSGNVPELALLGSALYGQGIGAAGYVAPTQQTLQGLAAQEAMGTAAQQQLAATLGGQYLNPFLQPLLQKTAGDIATSVSQQFSGAGRTPGSPMSQQQIVSQVAQAALPLAFGQYETERGRQLGIATRTPSLFQTGQQLEAIQRQRQLAPAQALQQYAGFI